MRKAEDAFRTISEVADQLEIQKHVLRFWELKFPQIKPLKRGGGRRYYRPADVELLRGIRSYLHNDGYTIKGVQKILRENGVETVKERGRTGASPAAKPAAPRKAAAKSNSKAAAPTVDAPSGLSPDVVKGIKAVIRELEMCRAGLSDGSRKSATPKPRAKRAAG